MKRHGEKDRETEGVFFYIFILSIALRVMKWNPFTLRKISSKQTPLLETSLTGYHSRSSLPILPFSAHCAPNKYS